MKGINIISSLLVICVLSNDKSFALNLPGPMVYVVTPSPRPSKIDEGRSAPFYYHNWIRRIDSGPNITTTSASMISTSTVKTPDLIFAEFESGSKGTMKKTIRKLLEKERVEAQTSTMPQPIYVPDEEIYTVPQKNNNGLPSIKQENEDTKESDYFEMYNKLYNNAPAPIYIPSTKTLTTITTTTTQATPNNVENIWHIIDSEKYNQYAGNWEEVSVGKKYENENKSLTKSHTNESVALESNNEDEKLYDNLALPGFATNPGNGAENESRAIRTESNIRFPYVNLKPFQMKTIKNPIQNIMSTSKKGNNLYTNLDNFHDLKNPVRGEAQDVIPMRHSIDRYNPAQPYLPQQNYGGNSKQSNAVSAPSKTTANLVPPPPPPPSPQLTDNDFRIPTNYESFPPYPPSVRDSSPPPPPVPKPIVSVYSPPAPPVDDSDTGSILGDNGPPIGLGYHYKPPLAPVQSFAPTVPPLNRPFDGYSYNKPSMTSEAPSMADMDDKAPFQGYQYNKLESQSPPLNDHMSPDSYQHHNSPPFQHDTVYPDLIFQKHHGDDSKDDDDMNGNSMGMLPPPDEKPDLHGPPVDDSGFPSDFPGDFKYHHDFDDHDFYHHHHHHTTTTSTTEMPRVNRFSYYYLGKKLYYLPLYFSVYFIVYVGALIIKAVLRHKIVYPNSWRPNDTTSTFFSKRSIESWDLSNENLHEVTGKVTHALATAAKMYMDSAKKKK